MANTRRSQSTVVSSELAAGFLNIGIEVINSEGKPVFVSLAGKALPENVEELQLIAGESLAATATNTVWMEAVKLLSKLIADNKPVAELMFPTCGDVAGLAKAVSGRLVCQVRNQNYEKPQSTPQMLKL